MDFSCKEGYEVDWDAETITVPFGSRCTIADRGNPALFEGWFDSWDKVRRNLVSSDNPYTFTATSETTLAAGYLSSTDLSAAGTANCYIAPSLKAGYRFNAGVMGNGRATTGITPRKLTGTSAKVIWETGSERGVVVRDAYYKNGWIYFSTGTAYGNAVIGLFDAKGGCVWSWHIWVANYAPHVMHHVYSDGSVFMDRNLGASNASGSDPAVRGLYYQWGRKDPFVYPSGIGSTARGACVYAPGYSYFAADPLVAGVPTVEYAVGHPWAFMCGAYPSDGNATPDWLSPANPNLWGNASSGTMLSDAGSKSIYDPCPPGWRVPDRKVFANAALTTVSATPKAYYTVRSGSTTNAVYPMGGWFATLAFTGNGAEAYAWTNAPAQAAGGAGYYKNFSTALKISEAGIEPLAGTGRDKALPVRCVKE